MPFPSPGDLRDPGIEPGSPAWQVDSLPLSHQETDVCQIINKYAIFLDFSDCCINGQLSQLCNVFTFSHSK